MRGRPALSQSERRRRELEVANRRLARAASKRKPRKLEIFPVWLEDSSDRPRCRICNLQLPHVCLDGREA